MPKLQKLPKPPKPGSMAAKADRHRYYELAVQEVGAEIDMIDENFTRITARTASVLREDFCGTANTSCEWVRRRDTNYAFGVDLDADVLAWGKRNNVNPLSKKQRQRIELIQSDVRTTHSTPADVILAMNFSYQIFKTRDELRSYFSAAREGLAQDGILFIDAFGGHETYRQVKEKTKFKEFNYYWDQASYDPISGHMMCHIHFKFPDGSKLKRAFSYDWRIYTLPELQEILYEAGFSNVTVYWEGTDEETGEGNGEYFPAECGEDDPAWIVYLSAQK